MFLRFGEVKIAPSSLIYYLIVSLQSCYIDILKNCIRPIGIIELFRLLPLTARFWSSHSISHVFAAVVVIRTSPRADLRRPSTHVVFAHVPCDVVFASEFRRVHGGIRVASSVVTRPVYSSSSAPPPCFSDLAVTVPCLGQSDYFFSIDYSGVSQIFLASISNQGFLTRDTIPKS